MRTTRLRHALAVVTAAAVLATMSAATVASPASAAKPRCGGFVATIVGTARGERIVGTNRRDVIVARGGRDVIYGRGGNDIICAGNGNDRVIAGPGNDRVFGQRGRDRINGGPGDDVLLGMVGNDTLNGALGTDTCLQGTGAGPILNCELPAPPPPPPPTLVVAYTDVNLNHLYDAGIDVVIAEIVDSDPGGAVSVGDTINMGQYPTRVDATTAAPARIRNTVEPWRIRSHTITAVIPTGNPNHVSVTGAPGTTHDFFLTAGTNIDEYQENGPGGSSSMFDAVGTNDRITVTTGSPSQALEDLDTGLVPSTGDDHFLDVDFLFTP